MQHYRHLGLKCALLALASAFCAGNAFGQAGFAPEAEIKKEEKAKAFFVQKLGDKVPLDLTFTDENGNEISLGQCIDGKPTIMILAYYRCTQLCGPVLMGVLEACW